MSTWQLSSDGGDCNFRWEIAGRILRSNPSSAPSEPPSLSPPMPSMADVLSEEWLRISDWEKHEVIEKTPMFRNGLGKSLALKESSIAKARLVLGENQLSNSVFLEREEEGGGKMTMFRSGLGKPVVLRESSLAKARAVLGETDSDDVLPKDTISSLSSSLFQTGSGKAVNISSSGLVKAKSLLGLEKENDQCHLNGSGDMKKLSASSQLHGWKDLSHLKAKEANNHEVINGLSNRTHSIGVATHFTRNKSNIDADSATTHSGIHSTASKVPPINFLTAGGRSLSVSSDALRRARDLLGGPELGNLLDDVDADNQCFTFFQNTTNECTPSNKDNDAHAYVSHQEVEKSKFTPPCFISPFRSSFKQSRSLVSSGNIAAGNNLIKRFDEVDEETGNGMTSQNSSIKEFSSSRPSPSVSVSKCSLENSANSRTNQIGRSSAGPLADISNSTGTACIKNKLFTGEKRLGRISSASPFKRPRISKFCSPLKKSVPFVPSGLSNLSSEHSCSKKSVSDRYPVHIPRKYIKEYFGGPPSTHTKLESLSDQVINIKPDNADKHVFTDEFGFNSIGAEAFFHMVAESGANVQYASKEWVTNHYKWIVWKLACYERCLGRVLTIANVLEELKYRYEREVNHGHRSAIKRILDGDASPSSAMVLCISAIYSASAPKIDTHSEETTNSRSNAKIELTDGWYSVDAVLDELLSGQLTAGKLFVGQKLRISGAGLSGWNGPISHHEASGTVSLVLNINGTYRGHWADRLGFCKHIGAPLAFRCIKSNGGPVPRSLVGVTRIYPLLYKERLGNGKSIVRSERTETKVLQLHSQRRLAVAEGIMSEYQRGFNASQNSNGSDGEEGAKLLNILETAAEPEILMAEMTAKQLTLVAQCKEKLEAARQTKIEKTIEKALENADLHERDVTPFMRVRVVGLSTRNYRGKDRLKEGIITIWNPTEKQKIELVEGQAYLVKGLVPTNSESETLYLQAKGSMTEWRPLSTKATGHFEPFFNPRSPLLLSNLGKVPLSSEFDVAALVVYVGEVYTDGQRKKQWVFVTDGSTSGIEPREMTISLLAISFCYSCPDDTFFPEIKSNLVGSTVGFCDIIKGAKDQANNLWVAEATENSNYFLSFSHPCCSHLKSAAAAAEKWAKMSDMIIDKLKEKVLFIVGTRR